MSEVVVGSLMSSPVTTCGEETWLKELVATLVQSGLSCVVVVNENKPVGIITERDLGRLFNQVLEGDEAVAWSQVKDVMTPDPQTVNATTPLFDALVITQTQGFRHLPVVDAAGELCGILTYSDLAKAYEYIINFQKKKFEEELGNKTRYLEELNEQLLHLSREDALLGIGNRRAMEVDLEYTHKSALRQKSDYALALFDVDSFKKYNDCYGHPAGDEALKWITQTIIECIRGGDRLYRYGGEELLLLMANTSLPAALEIAKRAVCNLHEKAYRHEGSPMKVLTMSGGVACFNKKNSASWQQVLVQADKALYKAKNSGRNQAQSASDT